MKKRIIKYGGCLSGLEEERAIIKSIRNSRKTRNWQAGEEAKLFEKELSDYLGTKHAILTTSGSCAGLLALSALELPRGSEVIIPAVTFPTIFNIILQCGLVPVVVDSKIGTYNMDVDEVKKAITAKTKAIIAVHALGNPVDMPKLMRLVHKKNIYVIEDNCLAEGTLVKTSNGDLPIERVKVGDKVLTRNGFQKVIRSWCRGEKEVITRFGITATIDHPFITKAGIKGFAYLEASDILYKWNEKLSCIEEKSIIDFQSPQDDKQESIIGDMIHTSRPNLSTGRFGLTTLVKFLKECMSTIKTEIHSTIKSLILDLLHPSYTVSSTSRIQAEMILPGKILPLQEKKRNYGTPQKRVESGMVDTEKIFGKEERQLKNPAKSAAESIKLTVQSDQNTALKNAKVKVYDLTIENENEFFANEILVHNCDGWGSTINGRAVGSFGDISITSFHAAHIVSMGVGGGVFCNDDSLAQRVRMYRDWGRQADINKSENLKHKGLPKDYNPRFIYEKIGYNFQILDLQAAMGRVQLKKTQQIKGARKKNFDYLVKHLSKHKELIMPKTIKRADVCWFALPITMCDIYKPTTFGGEYWFGRPDLLKYLESKGIETRPLFAGQIHRHPAYEKAKYRLSGKLVESERILRQSLWISCHPSLTKSDLEYMVKVFDNFFNGKN